MNPEITRWNKGVFIKSRIDVRQEVAAGDGVVLGIDLDHKIAKVGFKSHQDRNDCGFSCSSTAGVAGVMGVPSWFLKVTVSSPSDMLNPMTLVRPKASVQAMFVRGTTPPTRPSGRILAHPGPLKPTPLTVQPHHLALGTIAHDGPARQRRSVVFRGRDSTITSAALQFNGDPWNTTTSSEFRSGCRCVNRTNPS